ncbi:hypothetical protein BN6_33780 [Saccharothrix espanaensis DSM 44229]|uniref:Uncharacterized protein n=1 Tax=Saccharothrix espanaensis (strain ATCC 51144 / DSM 44229 / JCM 9112 / NBRC 15066 / NRRL 15764) TaxID=1179773 RepID=K0K2B1_SACES|nr:hypothetical protein BN6_33780 [Saccharothrix espanaensis DSM 44229]
MVAAAARVPGVDLDVLPDEPAGRTVVIDDSGLAVVGVRPAARRATGRWCGRRTTRRGCSRRRWAFRSDSPTR